MLAFVAASAGFLAPSLPVVDASLRMSVASRSGPILLTAPAFLTREDGKNGKLRKLLDSSGVASEELPCIAFERLPGFDELCAGLASINPSSWIVITSPEAATVFIEAWEQSATASQPPNLASVGAGTAKVLEAAGLPIAFVPSKATGKVLAAELPAEGSSVLYPASALAADTVANGLAARGVATTRIDTYTTVPAKWEPEDLARAKGAAVVTFASPSAVRVWAERVGTDAAAVCIGETSAAEARRLGFDRVVAPAKPGVESWATCCVEVAKES